MNTAILVTLLAAITSGAPQVSASRPLTGDYVEARSASVYAGPCHYNSEYMTMGRDCVMAWEFKTGTWKGVDLAGVKVMAAVRSDANLADGIGHESAIVVDSHATSAQTAAVLNVLREKCGAQLGQIVDVRRAEISFQDNDESYEVSARGFGVLSVEPMPERTCCLQPNMIWYSPMMPLTDKSVGYTYDSGYSGGALKDTWDRGDENSAFYGAFQVK